MLSFFLFYCFNKCEIETRESEIFIKISGLLYHSAGQIARRFISKNKNSFERNSRMKFYPGWTNGTRLSIQGELNL